MSDIDRQARRLAAQQREESAARQAKAAAAAASRQADRAEEARRLAVSTIERLKARGYPGMTPIRVKDMTYFGRERVREVAGFQVASFRRPWKDTTVATTIWLLSDGGLAADTGISSGIFRNKTDDPFLSQFLDETIEGLKQLHDE